MWTNHLKRLNCILILSSLLSTQVYARDWLAKQMFSINPTIQLYGPIQGTVSSKQYKTQVLRIILEEAHEQAREYLQVEDYDGYWGFIIAAMTVPLHEGSNIHFRQVRNDGTKCQDRSNSGSIFASSTRYTNVFNRIFKDGSPVVLPECEEISQQEFLTQLLHGHDGSDVGIMQVNLYWHERNYLSSGLWKSVRNSIRYGLQLVKNGYNGIYRNSSRYNCVFTNGNLDYDKMIRGAWAGIYNSGNLASSCRFANPASDWARNDINFKNSLDKIKALDNSADRSRYYEVNDTEDQLLGTIVSYYKNRLQSAAVLTDYLLNSRVSGTDTTQPTSDLISDDPSIVDQEPNSPVPTPTPPVIVSPRTEYNPIRLYSVNATSLNFRDGPGTNFNDCGNLPRNTEVVVKAIQGDWLEMVEDEVLAYYYEQGNKCQGDSRFAHKNYLIDKGPLFDDPETETPQEPTPVVVVETPVPTTTPAPIPVASPIQQTTSDNRIQGKALGWAKVREDRPNGYTMAPATGEVIGPAGQELIISEIVWNSSNSTHPWYKIESPVKGWVYGKYVVENSKD